MCILSDTTCVVPNKLRLRLPEWKRIHWSDECSFNLSKKNGNLRVWHRRRERFDDACIAPNRASGRISINVWGCVSNDCKLDLVDIHGGITSQKYIDYILRPHVEPHIDNHVLADRAVFMQDGAYRQDKPRVSWQCGDWCPLVASKEINIIENIWSHISRRINARDPLPRTAAELRAAVHNEWQSVTQARIRRLVAIVPRRLHAIVEVRGGHVNYW